MLTVCLMHVISKNDPCTLEYFVRDLELSSEYDFYSVERFMLEYDFVLVLTINLINVHIRHWL